MKKWSWLLAGLVFIAGTIRLIKTDFPITLNEAKENYTAFTLLKTGGLPLSFPTDNDFISPLAVYLRVPVVAAFGLTYFSNHLPGVPGTLQKTLRQYKTEDISFRHFLRPQ